MAIGSKTQSPHACLRGHFLAHCMSSSVAIYGSRPGTGQASSQDGHGGTNTGLVLWAQRPTRQTKLETLEKDHHLKIILHKAKHKSATILLFNFLIPYLFCFQCFFKEGRQPQRPNNEGRQPHNSPIAPSTTKKQPITHLANTWQLLAHTWQHIPHPNES